jgi:quercetin dioxygenase-like cupin family protein
MSGLVLPNDMKFVSKRWGWELWICNSELYCGKLLFVKQGHHLSFHHHDVKDEVLYVHSGRMWMMWKDSVQPEDRPPDPVQRIEMPPGYAFHAESGMIHQMQAVEDTLIIEFSTQHFDEDSFRTTVDLLTNHMPTEKKLGYDDGMEMWR